VVETLPPTDWLTSIESGDNQDIFVEGITAQAIPDAFNKWVATLQQSPEAEHVEIIETSPVFPSKLLGVPDVGTYSYFALRIRMFNSPPEEGKGALNSSPEEENSTLNSPPVEGWRDSAGVVSSTAASPPSPTDNKEAAP